MSVRSLCSPFMSVGQELDFSDKELFMSRFPVHRACRDGDVVSLVSLTENQAHLSAEDSCYGWTPIHWAAHYGQLECLVHLVQMGCSVNAVTSRCNQTPTHTAAFGGHPHCVVWLTQAGADVNRQDFVGEAPLHKAARSGSLECIQVLLLAGAKPHLRNSTGQTATDLAHAHGYLDCFQFITNAQKHLLQLDGVHVQNGFAPCGAGRLGRKRLPASLDSGYIKKARRAEDMFVQMHSSEDDEVESMNAESAQELSSDDDNKGVANGRPLAPAHSAQDEPPKNFPPPDNHRAAAPPSQRSSADMCGSLHLTGSPSSCVSQRPAWRNLMGVDCGDYQHYGHFHGFGDTAEELSDSIQAELRYKHLVANNIHLYHGH